MDSSLRRLPGQQSWFAAWPDNGSATARPLPRDRPSGNRCPSLLAQHCKRGGSHDMLTPSLQTLPTISAPQMTDPPFHAATPTTKHCTMELRRVCPTAVVGLWLPNVSADTRHAVRPDTPFRFALWASLRRFYCGRAFIAGFRGRGRGTVPICTASQCLSSGTIREPKRSKREGRNEGHPWRSDFGCCKLVEHRDLSYVPW